MAYPLQLVDWETDEGKEFILKLDNTISDLFGKIKVGEKTRLFKKLDEVPDYLTELANKGLDEIIKEGAPENRPWKASIGVYGRKVGTTIKRDPSVLYRCILNIGSTEVYDVVSDEGFDQVVLPNGFAVVLSPMVIESCDIKVLANPIRNHINHRYKDFVTRIRLKDYIRMTVVLDLPCPE